MILPTSSIEFVGHGISESTIYKYIWSISDGIEPSSLIHDDLRAIHALYIICGLRIDFDVCETIMAVSVKQCFFYSWNFYRKTFA